MTQVEIDIREIKEDLKNIFEYIKVLNNVLDYPTTYQYSPECFKDDNWQVPPTQACSEEELLKWCNK